MENHSLLLTLGVGVLVSFILFFILYRGLRWSSRLSALTTVLLVEAVYIPLAALNWAGLDVFAIHFAFFTMTAAGLGIIFNQRDVQQPFDTAEEGLAKRRFHWAPMVIVVFFLLLAVVDATIITLANKGASADFVRRFLPEPQRQSAQNVTSAFPGTVANDFQKQYDQYNHYLARIREQGERGWQVHDGWVEKPLVGQPRLFRISLTDKNGQAVTGARVQVVFLRPADKSRDMQVELPETSPGRYGEPVTLNAPGLWNLMMTISRGEDVHEVQGDTWVEAVP